MNRKNIALWTLYDYANSIPIVVFFLYFSQWLVIDNKVADIWFNLIFVGATLLLVLTSPIFGSISDKIGAKLIFLKYLTLLFFFCLLTTSILANFFEPNLLVMSLIIIFFLLANYFYQFSLTFYNSFLYEVSTPKIRGFVSGIGQAAGWLGQISGLLITLPLATGAIYLAGNPGRSQTFLPATILFFLLSLPMLFYFKETKRFKNISFNLKTEYRESYKSFKQLIKIPGVGRFLLGFFFFNDALITTTNNFPIYLEQVFRISDKTKTFLLLSVLITTVLGAIIIGYISDKIGLKKSLLIILGLWVITFPLISIINNFSQLVVVSALIGFFYGATGAVMRAVMTYLSPPKNLTFAFSYFTMAERFSTFVGPIAWGLIVSFFFANSGELRYRIAMFSMGIFVLIGLWIVKSIPAEQTN